MHRENREKTYQQSLKSLKKIAWITLSLNVFYFIVLYPIQGNPLNSFAKVLDLLIWGRAILSYLWFMTDLMIGIAFIALFYRLKRESYLIYSLALLPLSAILTGYLPLLGIKAIELSFATIPLSSLYYTLPSSLPYLVIGLLFKKHQQSVTDYPHLTLVLGLTLIVSYIENYIFARAGFLTWEFLSTPILSLIPVIYALRYPKFGQGSWAEKIGSQYSARIYYYHHLVLTALTFVTTRIVAGWGFHSIGFVYAFIGTVLLISLLRAAERRLNRQLLP